MSICESVLQQRARMPLLPAGGWRPGRGKGRCSPRFRPGHPPKPALWVRACSPRPARARRRPGAPRPRVPLPPRVRRRPGARLLRRPPVPPLERRLLARRDGLREDAGARLVGGPVCAQPQGGEASQLLRVLGVARRDHVDDVPVLHLVVLWRHVGRERLAVEHEDGRTPRHALPLAKGVHQLAQLRVELALEEDLGQVVRDHLEGEFGSHGGVADVRRGDPHPHHHRAVVDPEVKEGLAQVLERGEPREPVLAVDEHADGAVGEDDLVLCAEARKARLRDDGLHEGAADVLAVDGAAVDGALPVLLRGARREQLHHHIDTHRREDPLCREQPLLLAERDRQVHLARRLGVRGEVAPRALPLAAREGALHAHIRARRRVRRQVLAQHAEPATVACARQQGYAPLRVAVAERRAVAERHAAGGALGAPRVATLAVLAEAVGAEVVAVGAAVDVGSWEFEAERAEQVLGVGGVARSGAAAAERPHDRARDRAASSRAS
mmetsp:Transcript_24145/g.78642  ORF Transcript_24145/g.78642 Transcript_24145/m.78642 type:complete len:496 (-) Transcript_24145:9-1496(-)